MTERELVRLWRQQWLEYEIAVLENELGISDAWIPCKPVDEKDLPARIRHLRWAGEIDD